MNNSRQLSVFIQIPLALRCRRFRTKETIVDMDVEERSVPTLLVEFFMLVGATARSMLADKVQAGTEEQRVGE